MIQYCRCEDQAGTALTLCGSQPCCSLGDFVNGTNPISCIQCNMQACPGKFLLCCCYCYCYFYYYCCYYCCCFCGLGGPASVNGFIPHTRTFTLVDSVTGMINVTTTSDMAKISITIEVPNPTGYSTHFDTLRTATQVSITASQRFSSASYEIVNGNVIINGQSLFAAGPFLAVRTIPSTGSFSYKGSAGIYQLGTGSGVAAFSGIPTYYYVSPLGHLYQHSGSKAVRDKAPGKVFVRVNPIWHERLIITSENSFITEQLSKLSGAAMSIEPVGGGAAIGFNFERSGTSNAFMVTSSTSVNTKVSPTSYTRNTLTVGNMTFNNIDTVLLAGEGFEQYESANNEATAFVDYDSFFINGHNAVFSTSPRLTAMIREGQTFLAGGGTSQAAFRVDGNKVKYAGVTVFTLNSGFTTTDINGPGVISYDGQGFTVSATNTGIDSFAYDVGNKIGMAFNGNAVIAFPPNANVRLYTSGSEAFATSSQALIDNITAASMPTVITPGSTALYTTVLGPGNTGVLQLNGRNVVSFTGSAMSMTLSDGDTVSYNGGTITINPSNSRGPFTGIFNFTYAPSGQDIRQYNHIANETFNVDSSYTLVVDKNGNTFLTNVSSVKGLLTNPQFEVTFSNRDAQGNFFLMIGGSNIERMGRNTVRYVIPTGGVLRLLGTSIAGVINGSAIFPGVTVTSVQTYFSCDTVPNIISGSPPFIQKAYTPFYVYITGNMTKPQTVFITNRTTVDDAINNQLIKPSSTSTPLSTPLSSSIPVTPTPTTHFLTTAPLTTPTVLPTCTTLPPTKGTTMIKVITDSDDNPIVRVGDINLLSLTGSIQRKIHSDQSVGYDGQFLTLTGSNGQHVLSGNIRRFFFYNVDGVVLESRSVYGLLPGSGLLVYNDISGIALFTNSIAADTITSANPPATFKFGINALTDGSKVLTIGGSETHPITQGTTLLVSSVQKIQVNNSGYSVVNQDGTTALSVTQMFDKLIQCQTNSNQVNVSALSTTPLKFQGPQIISMDSSSLIVSNCPEVNNVIQQIIPTLSQTVGVRMDENNNRILVIGGRDIIPVDEALVSCVEKFGPYNNNKKHFGSWPPGEKTI